MAYKGNQQLPGFQPIKNAAGTAPSVHEYDVAAAYSTTIGEGNVVIKTATGLNLATATVTEGSVVGVAAHNRAASDATMTKVLVYDDPDQEFACIVDGTMTSTVAIEMVGQSVQAASNVYNATLGQGKTILDISGVVGTNSTTRPYQILGLLPAVGETRTSTYAQVRVKIGQQMHIYRSQAGADTRPT